MTDSSRPPYQAPDYCYSLAATIDAMPSVAASKHPEEATDLIVGFYETHSGESMMLTRYTKPAQDGLQATIQLRHSVFSVDRLGEANREELHRIYKVFRRIGGPAVHRTAYFESSARSATESPVLGRGANASAAEVRALNGLIMGSRMVRPGTTRLNRTK